MDDSFDVELAGNLTDRVIFSFVFFFNAGSDAAMFILIVGFSGVTKLLALVSSDGARFPMKDDSSLLLSFPSTLWVILLLFFGLHTQT